MRVAVIGGGISGLSIARLLDKRAEVVVFEGSDRPGGLIKCDIVQGSLFHRTGGHVFNTKRKDVLEWFWAQFAKDAEFTSATRNAVVAMKENKMVPYPIENHVYHLDAETQKSFIEDLVHMAQEENIKPKNFEDFLKHRFGRTLYELYFKPYNYKVWRRDLSQVPLTWLEGKLPMPSLQEMIYNNMNHVQENSFVHSSFFYAKKGGSQFIIDRLAEKLAVRCNTRIDSLQKEAGKWLIGDKLFDKIVFCGNIKQIPRLLNKHMEILQFTNNIGQLESHGTTTVFCEIDRNAYSWLYLPSPEHESHRIICTGNFAASNNAEGKFTATIEFTDEISKEEILDNLARIPFMPRYITHHYEKYTYPIQNDNTRVMISSLKQIIEPEGIYLLGRFAEWEYYNMDAAIGAAIDLNERIRL